MTLGILLLTCLNAGQYDDIIKRETLQAIRNVEEDRRQKEATAKLLQRMTQEVQKPKKVKYPRGDRKQIAQSIKNNITEYLRENQRQNEEYMKTFDKMSIRVEECVRDMRIMTPKIYIIDEMNQYNSVIKNTIMSEGK